jgi:DNA repair protein RadC
MRRPRFALVIGPAPRPLHPPLHHAMSLKDLPADLRPREKLLARGPSALADVELLALLLRTGYQGHGVFALSDEVLRSFGGFQGLLRAEPEALKRIKGLGPAKRAELIAVMEMARRALAQQMRQAPVLDAPQKLKDYLSIQLATLAHEVFVVLFLDNHFHMLSCEEMFRGTLTQTSVYPREVVRRALELRAAAVVLAHNHPSGVAEPSLADNFLTQSLKAALKTVDIRVLDHLIVGQGAVVSMAERGLT